MFNINKTFEFCYGHRVWSQELDGRFSNDLQCACRHLHGHEAKVQVYLSHTELVRGMVTDFRHLEWLKKWLNTYVDHRFIIDSEDPLFDHLFGDFKERPFVTTLRLDSHLAGYTFLTDSDPNLTAPITPALKELFEGVLIVDFVPTSENLSKWIHGLVQHKMSELRIQCTRVDWWETPKSCSSYDVGYDPKMFEAPAP